MSKIEALISARTKADLAHLLGVKTSFLTYVLYVLKPSTQYEKFEIPKKSGGVRTIWAPSEKLKSLQAELSILLQDCIEEIEGVRAEEGDDSTSTLSHGFVRGHSIITNAMQHLNKKNVLNVDLKDFFDSFNFGRVRGFFIKNKNFHLEPSIATVIAQISCHDDKLPQGSPCSPVITNLITHALDVRLATLAKKHSCSYSRYADDITFSTRKKIFPPQIMRHEGGVYLPGKRFISEIRRAGFEINHGKTRILYKDSRQEVTGLVANQKPSVKSEYWRTAKAQCHALFQNGTFTKEVNGVMLAGSINELEGKLNFIDQIDHFNRLRSRKKPDPIYVIRNHGYKQDELLSGRERTFSRFLYYRWFYGNKKATILCEGKTDNVYLKAAISRLATRYPKLVKPETTTQKYELLVSFFKYTARTRFFLNLHGGTPYIDLFIKSFNEKQGFYSAPNPEKPVIIVMDNDSGFNDTFNLLKKMNATPYPSTLKKNNFRNSEFIHVGQNLYVVLTPLGAAGKETAIEDLFSKKVLGEKVSGKTFNPCDKTRDNAKEYGKEVFAKRVVLAKKDSISFSGFKPILKRIVQCIDHYESIRP
ncbi:retron Ec67 family RNA-directed DNA polymerase/endonuclease [Litchfieldella rifensis]|uniref:RNA-directed DNA polymerase n=1 Tax=Litchfieldella rifensis TaxID=762643 RepID=A0ABV7LQD9_9GAMM